MEAIIKKELSFSLTATAASGYRFKEWQEAAGSSYISANDKTKSSVQFTVGNTGAEITAIFEAAEKNRRSNCIRGYAGEQG